MLQETSLHVQPEDTFKTTVRPCLGTVTLSVAVSSQQQQPPYRTSIHEIVFFLASVEQAEAIAVAAAEAASILAAKKHKQPVG